MTATRRFSLSPTRRVRKWETTVCTVEQHTYALATLPLRFPLRNLMVPRTLTIDPRQQVKNNHDLNTIV